MILILCGFFFKNLKYKQLPENISGSLFFSFLFSFLTWRQIWLIRLVGDPHCVWGFSFSFFLWRDFLTWAHKKGAMGYDLYKGGFFFWRKRKAQNCHIFGFNTSDGLSGEPADLLMLVPWLKPVWAVTWCSW
jgi:hypothetical protein